MDAIAKDYAKYRKESMFICRVRAKYISSALKLCMTFKDRKSHYDLSICLKEDEKKNEIILSIT